MLASTTAMAEDQYPASDFQPKVVYQDEAATKQSGSSTSLAVAKPSSSSSSDSQYPAANFQPKVLYSDDSYQHNSAVPSSSSSSQGSVDVSTGSGSSSVAAPKEESSVGYLLGLIVLCIAGYILFKKGAGLPSVSAKASSNSVKSPGGLTGVARYVLKTSGTGVSRYLEKNTKNAPSSATGVAKYLAKQVSSPKTSAGQAPTGVEKYMRNKG